MNDLQAVLWVLSVVSALLTVRAGIAGSWLTLWVAALVSVTASLLAVWSVGSLLFVAPCVQLALAVVMRRSTGPRAGMAIIAAGLASFVLVINGLAFARVQDAWLVGIPLAFVVWTSVLFGGGALSAPRLGLKAPNGKATESL